jgi:hypothetical protein
MSADQITKSIRRIVRGLEDDPIGLADADEYKSIGTSRGEAFINSRGDVTGSASEGSDDKEEKPSSTTPPTDNSDDNDTGGEGGTNSGSDPSGSEAGDVADVDDAVTTATQIGTLTGTDPATGTLMSLNLNTLEGIEYIPPPGWPNPDHGPAPTDFVLGIKWVRSGGQGALPDHSTKSQVKTISGAQLLAAGYSITADTSSNVAYFKPFAPFFEPAASTYSWVTNACTPTEGDVTCPLTAEGAAETTQPSDSSCQVVFDSSEGGYKGAANDPDCSAAQKLPTDFVIIRSVSDPSKFFRYTRLANGGTKITQVDSGGTPVPGTITKTTDEGGRVDGFFDVSLDAGIK